MSVLFGGGYEDNSIETLINKATSEYRPNAKADLSINLEICDLIRSKQVRTKEALKMIKARLLHPNPNISLLAIDLIDACVKNAGKHFLSELCTREMVDCLVCICSNQGGKWQAVVVEKTKEYFQIWALAIGHESEFSYILSAYRECKRNSDCAFPASPPPLPPTLISSATPPEWIDSPKCHRCKDVFGLLRRKHHCRRCGNCFCSQCSERECELPEFGLYTAVRVCDECYAKLFDAGTEIALPSPANTQNRGGWREEKTNAAANADGLDADLEKAIKASLEDSNQQQAIANNPPPLPLPKVPSSPTQDYDEDEALKQAIVASLADSKIARHNDDKTTIGNTSPGPAPEDHQSQTAAAPKTSSVAYPSHTQSDRNREEGREGGELDEDFATPISTLERENVHMFIQLINQLQPSHPTLKDPQLIDLYQDMQEVSINLHKHLMGDFVLPGISGIVSDLDTALAKYDFLAGSTHAALPTTNNTRGQANLDRGNSQENDPINLTMIPSRPKSRTGSIITNEALLVDTSIPSTKNDSKTRQNPTAPPVDGDENEDIPPLIEL